MYRMMVFRVSVVLSVILVHSVDLAQVLPDQTTKEDISSLLDSAAAGSIDPQELIAILSKRGDANVPMLKALLLAERSVPGGAMRSGVISPRQAFKPMPAHRVLLRALENVGNAEAFACVYNAATTHADLQIRGCCFGSLAQAFQAKAGTGGIQPDKQLLHLFLSSSGDTLIVSDLGKRVGELAREGYREWTARGGAIPVPAVMRPSESKESGSLRPYWEHWWATRASKITWDPATALFVTPRF